MKHLKIAFGLAMMAGIMAVATSPAMALGPRWVHCVKVAAGTGHWTTNKCTTAGTGEWETKEVGETSEVTSSSTGLELEDKAGGTTIKCSGLDTGTVGKEGTDSTKTITNISCSFVKAGSCESSKPVTAEPVNLPWSTRLEERTNAKAEKEVRDVITSLAAGKVPGYNVKCTVGGIFKISDECTGIITTNVRANRVEGTVETEFEKESEPGSCTVGGAGQGFVHGITINRLRSGNAFWILAEAIKT